MIPLGNLYRVIVVAYLLQLYRNRNRLLRYVDRSFPLKYFLGHPSGHPLRHPLGHPLEYPLKYPLEYSLGHPIQAQNYYLYSRA